MAFISLEIRYLLKTYDIMTTSMESSIKVKLLSSGRYTWEIIVIFNEHQKNEVIESTKIAQQIDRQLKQEFPDHVSRGSGRVSLIEED